MKNNLLIKVGQVKGTSPFIVLLCALLIAIPLLVNAQDRTIQGTVTSMLDGTPLPGVNVLIKGSTSGTITDVNGNYNIGANENEVLIFSFVGFVTEEIAVSEVNNSTYNIALAEDIEALGEVVVVGYGSIKKSDVTGAVASVTPDELTKIATPDVVQALQGRVAGVQVIANSGEPGAGMKIRIRGLSSINGGSSPLYVVDGFQTGDISYLNPNDIESMEILKDASATAIYGSRGASGVVLITTKSGKVGKPQFTFDAYGGMQQAANTLDLLNASEYATLRLEAYANDGRELDPLNEEFVRLDFAKQGGYEGTDWQDEILNPAPIQNYSLSVSGGSEKVRYSLSGTYFSQDGLVKNSGMDKFFVNLNTDYELADWLTTGVIVNFVNTDKSNYNNDFYSGILPTTVALSPVIPAFDKPTRNFGRDDISYTNNAARVVTESKYDNYILNKLVGNIFLNAEITKGLSFRTQFGVNLDNRKDKIFRPKFFMATDEARDRSELYERRSESFGWISTNYFTYDRSFGNHAITALAGFENQYGRYSDISVTGFDVPANEDQHYIGAANDPNFVVRSGQSENALQSYFGRINYSFIDRYLLTGTVRYDGSSKFTEEYRWGAFPSVTAGWIISEEKFLEGVQPISFLKLRAGWGQVGNQNVGDYRFVTTVDINQLYVLGGQIVQGAAPRTLSNPAIQWETTETMNFGLDAGFSNDKFTLTADYFIKKTRDMLLGVPIPIYVGALSPTVNAGTMENKGLEVSLGYRNHERKLKYEFNLNFDIIENEITSLAGGEPISSGGVGKVGATTRTEEGNEVAYFYGLKTDGIFNTEDELAAYINEEGNPILPNAEVGDVKFMDVNGDGLVDANDRVKLGSATPDFNYGFSANLSYENFDFSFLVTGVQGAEAVNGLAHLLKSSNGLNNSYSSRMDRWTPENPNTNEPRMTFADANRNAETFSDRYVEDASYIRLKTIQLGYNLQLNSLNMKSLRLYLAADNLITLTDYTGFDPEIGDLYQSVFYYGVDQATYPNPQVFRAGLNLKF